MNNAPRRPTREQRRAKLVENTIGTCSVIGSSLTICLPLVFALTKSLQDTFLVYGVTIGVLSLCPLYWRIRLGLADYNLLIRQPAITGGDPHSATAAHSIGQGLKLGIWPGLLIVWLYDVFP